MSARVRLLLAFTALVIVASLAAVAGSRRSPTSSADTRASTLVTTPNGASAFAEAAELLGYRVERVRSHRPRALAGAGGTFVILDPSFPVTGEQTTDLLELPGSGVALLVAGAGARPLFRCFGFDTLALPDSVTVQAPLGGPLPVPRVGLALRPIADSVIADSSGIFDALVTECTVPRARAVDTLALADGHLLAVRFRPADSAAPVTLVGDAGLFRNRTLRSTDAGPLVLGWLESAPLGFDEYHHGFLAGGSLAEWTLRWSGESPWGWLVWHAAVVGALALLAGAFRFGPPLPVIDRRRRSVAEHVQALARALRASGGHRVAIELLISGLRRRLTTGTQRGSPAEWLARVAERPGNPRIAELATRLQRLDRPRPSEAEVLAAAHLVEDLWTEMHT